MSLVLYGDATDPNENSSEENEEYSVILDNRYSNTLVLYNKHTHELVLMNNNLIEVERTCPHCGSTVKVNAKINIGNSNQRRNSTSTNNTTTAADTAEGGSNLDRSGDNLGSIHANYFRLLENSIDTREPTPFNSNGNSPLYDDTDVGYVLESTGHQLPSSIFQQGYFSNFFKLRELLGKGSRGSVYKVEHFLNDVSLGVFALKKITIGDDPKWLLKVLNEVNMLVKISYNNKNLVNYNHVWLEVDSINEFGPKVPCAFILQQYCSGGSLEDFVNNIKNPVLTIKEMKQHHIKRIEGRFLKNEEILLIFSDLVNGVSELHNNHIIHRDLKPSNCLMSGPYLSKFELTSTDMSKLPTALIGDFGESQLEGELRSASGYTGTIEYTAPELFLKKNQFSKKTDMYSLGMILYFLCYSGVPFKQVNNLELLREEIRNFEVLEIRKDLHQGFVKLIKMLTDKHPQNRPGTATIIKMLNDISMVFEKDSITAEDTFVSESDTSQDLNNFNHLLNEDIDGFTIRNDLSSKSHELIDDSDMQSIVTTKSVEGIIDKPINYGHIKLYLQSDPIEVKLLFILVQLLVIRYGLTNLIYQYQSINLLLVFTIGVFSRGTVSDSFVYTICLCLASIIHYCITVYI